MDKANSRNVQNSGMHTQTLQACLCKAGMASLSLAKMQNTAEAGSDEPWDLGNRISAFVQIPFKL